jgi:hypothetical protein
MTQASYLKHLRESKIKHKMDIFFLHENGHAHAVLTSGTYRNKWIRNKQASIWASHINNQ